MIRIVSFLVATLLLFSCNSTSPEDIAVYKSLDEGMLKSIKTISYQNDIVYKEFATKKTDPVTAEKAKKMSGVVDTIREFSDSLVKYIKRVKFDLDEYAVKEEKIDNEMESISLEDKKTLELYNKIQSHKKTLLNLNQGIRETFKSDDIIIIQIDSSASKVNEAFFNNKPLMAIQCILTKIINDIRIMENALITYCNYSSCATIERFDVFNAIVGQSSNIVKPGDAIEITAGVGVFSIAANPAITINNEVVKINESAVAIHKIKASQKPGLHSVPVKIEFYNPDGTKAKHEYTIEYTVKE